MICMVILSDDVLTLFNHIIEHFFKCGEIVVVPDVSQFFDQGMILFVLGPFISNLSLKIAQPLLRDIIFVHF